MRYTRIFRYGLWYQPPGSRAWKLANRTYETNYRRSGAKAAARRMEKRGYRCVIVYLNFTCLRP
jgi:hypothetical protein